MKLFNKIFLSVALFGMLAYDHWLGAAGAPLMGFLNLVGIDQTDTEECDTCDSGLARLLLVECSGIDLEASTWDADTGCITSLAFTGTGIAAEYVPDSDGTAFLNFNGSRNGAIHNVDIDGFAKFRCLNKNKIAEANKLKKSCCFVAIAEYNDCNIMVGGLDVVTNCSTDGELRFSKRNLTATVSVIPGSGDDESRLEVVFEGQQRCFTALDQTITTYEDLKALLAL